MKKLFYSFAMLALLVGCSDDATDDGGKKEPEPEPTPTEQVITATFEESEIDLAWAEGDAISVFHSLANEKWAYNEEAAGFKKADNTAPTKKLNYVFGIYPYNDDINAVNVSNEITVNFPNKQAYVAGGFDAAKAPMLAAAEKDATALEFKPAYALVSVKVFGTAVIKEIALESANGEKLAGIATATMEVGAAPVLSFSNTAAEAVSMALNEPIELAATEDSATTFTFAVAPNTFSKGFFVKAVDVNDNVYRKAFNAEVVADRNTSVTLEGSYEIIAKTVTKTIFDAKFNTDGTATDAGIFGLNIETITNGDGETPNMRVYTHPDFEANNIAQFNFFAHNEARNHSFFFVDFTEQEEFKAAMQDGFTFEVVSAHIVDTWDWWISPAATNKFRFFKKNDNNNDEWHAHFNSMEWGPWAGGSDVVTSSFYGAKEYKHSLFIYDSNNQCVKTYTNGVKDAEITEVTEFDLGSFLAIGGYPNLNTPRTIGMAYNGDVALVKIYDQPLTDEEIAEKVSAVTLPEAPILPEAAAISDPLFDLKWNDDRTATDAGSAKLAVNSNINDLTEIVNVSGYGNIVNFAVKPNDGNWASPDPTVVSNSDYSDGFYRIEYTENEEFKNKLRDGFTLEVICVSNFRQGGFWMRPFSTDRWGFMMHDDNYRWRTVANGGENSWGAHGDSEIGYPAYTDEAEGAPMKSFTHILYVYNAEGKEYGLFIDGKCNCARPLNGFEVGTMMSVPGMPYTDKLKMAHGWNGKVAAVRIYDEAFTQEQRIKRYNDMKPVIETLNTAIAQ